ncbi:DUF6350 family protein [Cellulomonas fimi]|uniref:PE-PGRS family protein n=1 Tax=Cellulomonas fimi TaxID=1708 RepID=A0A7Y0QFE2_CELFI|nr:DUF6350 family protein [Cellulomonas fimi]NMR18976.1 hypothetical protein [Cellulomonas fimi]
MTRPTAPPAPRAGDRLSQLGRRVLTTDDGSPSPFASAIDGAPRWAGGLAAGLQAAILSLAVVVAPTVAAYVVTSADPSNADVGWVRSVGVGASFWLLGHGVPLAVGGVAVTLVPLGITALALFSGYASARRSGHATWSGFAAAVLGYVAVVLGVAVGVGAGATGVLRAGVGGLVVAGLSLGAGLLARPGAPELHELSRPLWSRVPSAVRVGAAAGGLAAALLVMVAAGVAATWIVQGRDTVAEVGVSLGLDVVGGTVLTLAQLALLPVLVMWALAYVAGPGFVVGTGSYFTPAEVVPGPLPALPVLGALPTPDSPFQLTAWLPLVLVGVGGVAGWWLHRRLEPGAWWRPLLACACASATAGLAAGALVSLASGSVGPGRMTEVGASGVLVGLSTLVGTLIGLVVVVLPARVEVRTEAARAARRLTRGGSERGSVGLDVQNDEGEVDDVDELDVQHAAVGDEDTAADDAARRTDPSGQG